MAGRHIVSYHYPCPDGVFAALAASLHFRQNNIHNVLYVPNRVFAPCKLETLNLKKEDTLYMLDYVGPPAFAIDAAKLAGRVVLLDHHKTAFDLYEGAKHQNPSNLEVNLRMDHSGATIALQYFKPKISSSVSRLYSFIEDADLWRWAIPDSKAFHTGLGSMEIEYDVHKNRGVFEELEKLDADSVIAQGEAVQKEQDAAIAEAVSDSVVVQIRKGAEEPLVRCLAFRVPAGSNLGKLRSQLGNSLADEAARRGLAPMGLVAYLEAEMTDFSQIKCSLRSLGDEDTTAVSKCFGGGGHKNASSFVTKLADYESWVAVSPGK